MRGTTEVFIIPRAEILRHDNTGTHGNAAEKADDQKQQTAGGGHRRQRTVAEQPPDNQRIGSIVKLLEQVTEEQRERKCDDLPSDRSLGHTQLTVVFTDQRSHAVNPRDYK